MTTKERERMGRDVAAAMPGVVVTRITVKWLRTQGACVEQRERFHEAFPRGVDLASAADLPGCLRRAREASLDLDWLIERLLRAPAQQEYERVMAPAQQEYERVTDAAEQEYERVTDAARQEYERVTDAAEQEYERVTDAAWRECERVTDAAWREYERVTDAAEQEYERVTDAAWREYERVRAAAEQEYERVRDAVLISLTLKPCDCKMES